MKKLALLVLLVVWGCGGDSPISPEESVAGTYTLQTINGEGLPVLWYSETGYTEEVLSASERLNSDGTFSESFTWRVTTNGVGATVTETDAGTFTASGGTVHFTYADGLTMTGSVSGNTLTIIESGFSLVFQR